MRNVQWQTKENFVFPSTIGGAKQVETLNVTPRFTVDRSAENLRLTGIYHLAAKVEFDAEKTSEKTDESTILIEDVEIDTESKLGYFEYAVPFNIDLPPEAADPLDLAALNSTFEINQNGELAVIWDIECTYKEVIEIPNQQVAEAEEREAQIAAGISDELPEAELAEGTEAIETQSSLVIDNKTFSEGNEVLSFIAELEDGYSTTAFHLNDVFVKSEG